jgi:hypothetical protein
VFFKDRMSCAFGGPESNKAGGIYSYRCSEDCIFFAFSNQEGTRYEIELKRANPNVWLLKGLIKPLYLPTALALPIREAIAAALATWTSYS